MGVPALFRWLSQKYPKIIERVVEEQQKELDGIKIPIDISGPNPNGREFDNLYLDMNGIVHPCSHPEDKPPPETEEEMMLEVFKYTDRVFNMVRPRKLLMIAVDGVAPRAKMNQQRSRRFRSAKEAKEKDDDKAELLKMLKAQRKKEKKEEPDEEQVVKKTWDSNAITPGTPFMFKLAASLRYWCAYKINTDPGWQNVKVIISDASVPGEGEHKIMEFVRSQRSDPFHDPNTRHVMYGLDADLIMLGLATHEPHFHILREDVFFQESKGRTCRICGQTGHYADQCRGEAKQKDGEFDEKDSGVALKPFIWLHVSVLREYLAAELETPHLPFRFDLERALDDWVFMCFFVGNDFLPHLPSLDIKENGIDTLIAIWRDNIALMGGYVTRDGQVDLARAQYILNGLAKQEDAIFRKRRDIDVRRENNAKRRKLEEEDRNKRESGSNFNKSSKIDGNFPTDLPTFAPGKGETIRYIHPLTHDMVTNRSAMQQANEANKSAAAELKARLLHKTNQITTTTTNGTETQSNGSSSVLGKRKVDSLEEDQSSTPGRKNPESTEPPTKVADPEAAPDTVRLWEDGYADRYYEQKFQADPSDVAFRNKVAAAYVEGLAWVLLYYFQGCASWTWYYPYHYAPFAADFVDLADMKIKFEKGKPFHPYEQLMGVMPVASNHTIPGVFHSLMTDEDSPIVDFYPEDFPIDLNGKKWAWQGVALLPFIDSKRLLEAMATRYPGLSSEEVERNEFGKDVLIFSDKNPLYDVITSNFYSKKQGAPKLKLDSKISRGLAGKVEKNPDYLPQSQLSYPFDSSKMPNIDEDHSLRQACSTPFQIITNFCSVNYQFPKSSHVHKSMLLVGVKFDPQALNSADIEETKSKAMTTGRSFGGAPLRNGYGSNRGGRGGRVNYSDNRAADQRPNPFAGHLPQGYIPPSHIMANNGYAVPVPPPGYGQYPPPAQQYANQIFPAQQGYIQQQQAPQPPPPGQNNGWSHEPPRQGRSNGRPDRPLPDGYGYNR